eukprot:gene19901-biopygen11557
MPNRSNPRGRASGRAGGRSSRQDGRNGRPGGRTGERAAGWAGGTAGRADGAAGRPGERSGRPAARSGRPGGQSVRPGGRTLGGWGLRKGCVRRTGHPNRSRRPPPILKKTSLTWSFLNDKGRNSKKSGTFDAGTHFFVAPSAPIFTSPAPSAHFRRLGQKLQTDRAERRLQTELAEKHLPGRAHIDPALRAHFVQLLSSECPEPPFSTKGNIYPFPNGCFTAPPTCVRQQTHNVPVAPGHSAYIACKPRHLPYATYTAAMAATHSLPAARSTSPLLPARGEGSLPLRTGWGGGEGGGGLGREHLDSAGGGA